MNPAPFTPAEFRERIARLLRTPGSPPTYRNSAPAALVRTPQDKGFYPPRSIPSKEPREGDEGIAQTKIAPGGKSRFSRGKKENNTK